MVTQFSFEYDGDKVKTTDRLLICDDPGCNVVRNVLEFKTADETERCLTDWTFKYGWDICPRHRFIWRAIFPRRLRDIRWPKRIT
jgi:hypothetical protein